MRAKEIRERSDEELMTLLEDHRDQLFRARLKNATHQLENTDSIKKTRREIARILTVAQERGLGAEKMVAAESQAEGNEE